MCKRGRWRVSASWRNDRMGDTWLTRLGQGQIYSRRIHEPIPMLIPNNQRISSARKANISWSQTCHMHPILGSASTCQSKSEITTNGVLLTSISSPLRIAFFKASRSRPFDTGFFFNGMKILRNEFRKKSLKYFQSRWRPFAFEPVIKWTRNSQ